MTKNLQPGQIVEIVKVNVSAENKASFLTKRKAVDAFVAGIPGYLGTEITQLNGNGFFIFIRWENEESVKNAQKITVDAPVISEWLSLVSEFISFETTIVQYEN